MEASDRQPMPIPVAICTVVSGVVTRLSSRLGTEGAQGGGRGGQETHGSVFTLPAAAVLFATSETAMVLSLCMGEAALRTAGFEWVACGFGKHGVR